MILQDKLKQELAYTNKLNRLLSKQSDALAEVLRFYANCDDGKEFIADQGERARQVLREWYDL